MTRYTQTTHSPQRRKRPANRARSSVYAPQRSQSPGPAALHSLDPGQIVTPSVSVTRSPTPGSDERRFETAAEPRRDDYVGDRRTDAASLAVGGNARLGFFEARAALFVDGATGLKTRCHARATRTLRFARTRQPVAAVPVNREHGEIQPDRGRDGYAVPDGGAVRRLDLHGPRSHRHDRPVRRWRC